MISKLTPEQALEILARLSGEALKQHAIAHQVAAITPAGAVWRMVRHAGGRF